MPKEHYLTLYKPHTFAVKNTAAIVLLNDIYEPVKVLWFGYMKEIGDQDDIILNWSKL